METVALDPLVQGVTHTVIRRSAAQGPLEASGGTRVPGAKGPGLTRTVTSNGENSVTSNTESCLEVLSCAEVNVKKHFLKFWRRQRL